MRKSSIFVVGLLVLLTQLALAAGALAAPMVTVSPSSGPRGSAIGVGASGLSPATDHRVQLVRGTGNANTVRLFEDRPPSDARGEPQYRLAVDQEPGAYTVRIVALGGALVATAPFTVTAARKASVIVLGLLMLLTQLALAAGALAAPMVTVSPSSGPRGSAMSTGSRAPARCASWRWGAR